MKLVTLNLNLGPGRSLQPSDLQYLTNDVDVVCYHNAENGLNIDGWSEVSSGTGEGIVSKLNATSKQLGLFRKWAFQINVDGYIFLLLKKDTKPQKILKYIKKSELPVLVVADWESFPSGRLAEYRQFLAYYGYGHNGVLVSNSNIVTKIIKLGVDHNNNVVVGLNLV